MNIVLIRIAEFKNNRTYHPRDIIPSFELLNIASLLKKDKHNIKYFDNEVLKLNESKFKKLILESKADVYIFHFQPWVGGTISRFIKILSKSKITIAFGPTVQYQTEEFLKISGANFVALGEPEFTIEEIIKVINRNKLLKLSDIKKIKGLAFLNEGKLIINPERAYLNPNKLPFMEHGLIQNMGYKIKSKNIIPKGKTKWDFILSSRGCPYKCSFCAPSIRLSVGKIFRAQDPKRTVDEIEYLINKFKVNAISFEDDVFTLNKKRVQSICKEIIKRKINISWTVATRLDCLDEKTVRLMKKAGCEGMSTGVESGSQRIIKIINKGESIETMKKGIEILKKYNIAITANIIIGHPTETLKDINMTIKFIKELNPLFVHIHYLTPYPGVKIFEKYFNKAKDNKQLSHRTNHNFNVSNVETKKLHKMIIEIYLRHYFSLRFLKSYLKYRLKYWIYDPLSEISLFFETLSYLLSTLFKI